MRWATTAYRPSEPANQGYTEAAGYQTHAAAADGDFQGTISNLPSLLPSMEEAWWGCCSAVSSPSPIKGGESRDRL